MGGLQAAMNFRRVGYVRSDRAVGRSTTYGLSYFKWDWNMEME
jgi:hypothetical protein